MSSRTPMNSGRKIVPETPYSIGPPIAHRSAGGQTASYNQGGAMGLPGSASVPPTPPAAVTSEAAHVLHDRTIVDEIYEAIKIAIRDANRDNAQEQDKITSGTNVAIPEASQKQDKTASQEASETRQNCLPKR
ncbi:hypothetical protein VE02_03324 [Pseudogymnoascus sp. 03VT05]|nr:hypothetical protein VE02_03324 [Pseudogymnoascus sp. 03VT05]